MNKKTLSIDEALEEYPNSTGTLNDLINLIKEHKLEDRTNIQEVLKVYLSNATEYKDINDFSRDLFSSLGANIDTPIAGVSFDENTRTSTITLDDELSDEDYEAIIRFNLSPADSLTMTAAGIKLLKDNNEIVADNLKTIYEEQGFKELLLNDFQLLGLTQLQHSSLFKSNPDLFHKLVDSDPAYTKAFIEANKEKDLDVDGIPDRIDIDDTRNSVQTVSDLSLVENQTSKNEEVKSTPKRGMSK